VELVGAQAVGGRFAGGGGENLRAAAAAGLEQGDLAAPVAGSGDGVRAAGGSKLQAAVDAGDQQRSRVGLLRRYGKDGGAVEGWQFSGEAGHDDSGEVVAGGVVEGLDLAGLGGDRPADGPWIVAGAAVELVFLLGCQCGRASDAGKIGGEAAAVGQGGKLSARISGNGAAGGEARRDGKTLPFTPVRSGFSEDLNPVRHKNQELVMQFQRGKNGKS